MRLVHFLRDEVRPPSRRHKKPSQRTHIPHNLSAATAFFGNYGPFVLLQQLSRSRNALCWLPLQFFTCCWPRSKFLLSRSRGSGIAHGIGCSRQLPLFFRPLSILQRTYEELPSLYLRARALDHHGDPPNQRNHWFWHQNDMSGQFRRTTANNAAETLSLQPSIRACECNGVDCVTESKKPGDTIQICLRSNFLDIQNVSQISLRLGDVTYQPIVNGTANAATNVARNGNLAIVTTMLVSALFQDSNNSTSRLQVQGQVSFVPQFSGNRYLSTTSDFVTLNTSRYLTIKEKSAYIVIVVSVLFGIVTISAAVESLIAEGHICFCISKQHDEKEGTQKWAPYIQRAENKSMKAASVSPATRICSVPEVGHV